MTMQIRALGVSASDHASSKAHDRRAPIRSLAQALKAGDLQAASAAYATLAAKAPQRAQGGADAPFARLGAAIAAGDVDAARSAFASIFTSRMPGRDVAVPATPASDPTGVPSPDGAGSLLNLSA